MPPVEYGLRDKGTISVQNAVVSAWKAPNGIPCNMAPMRIKVLLWAKTEMATTGMMSMRLPMNVQLSGSVATPLVPHPPVAESIDAERAPGDADPLTNGGRDTDGAHPLGGHLIVAVACGGAKGLAKLEETEIAAHRS